MNKYNYIKEYCTGCGLCHSVLDINLVENGKGFSSPKINDIEKHFDFLQKVCPAGGEFTDRLSTMDIWGENVCVLLGWSKNEYIRRMASSGGVLTTLCCEILKSNEVDGIIQTISDEHIPFGTRTVISRTPEEVCKCMGSRYSVSAPLEGLLQMVIPGEKYAFVGKPCDVSALRSYLELNCDLKKQIKYFFSFFCAGMPSNKAQEQLLKTLNTNIHDCESLSYRGNGWPGYTTAQKRGGQETSITYNESWGKILGRDVLKACRFCIDGIGLSSDIACGDAWYLNIDGTPDFTEHDGRNVIMIRTEAGLNLINTINSQNSIYIQPYDLYFEELKVIQKYQYERKATMKSMLAALRLLNKPYPRYNSRILDSYSKYAEPKLKVRRFIGTFRRAIDGRV